MPKDFEKGPWNEEEFVSRLKSQDEEAFRVLIRQYKGKIYGIALGITLDREESLDIVQEVLTRVYEKIGTFKGDAKLSTWIHRITVNHCLNWRRKWKRRFRWRHESLDSPADGRARDFGTDAYQPERLYHSKDLKHRLWKSLKELPQSTRVVFVLKELEGLSYDEIARMLGVKKGTVSSRLFHARKQLRESLQPYLDEEKK